VSGNWYIRERSYFAAKFVLGIYHGEIFFRGIFLDMLLADFASGPSDGVGLSLVFHGQMANFKPAEEDVSANIMEQWNFLKQKRPCLVIRWIVARKVVLGRLFGLAEVLKVKYTCTYEMMQ